MLRDRKQFLVNIPPAVSDSDSSLLEGEELAGRPWGAVSGEQGGGEYEAGPSRNR